MFRNYVKIAVRSLLKHKLYSGINVFGLALGMTCSLLIGLWVRDELSYDRFLPDADNISFVRVNFQDPNTGEIGTNFFTPGPLQEAIAQSVPEVAAVTKINFSRDLLIKAVGGPIGEKAAKEKGHYATDDFFGVFDLPAVYGDPKAALAQAWWALDKWLGTFAYQTELTWWIFSGAGVLAVVIAFLTVSYQSVKAALVNPVQSLRAE